MAPLSVSACVCHSVTFRELLDLGARLDPERRLPEDELIDQLSARTRCSSGCGMCRPYLRLALRTGSASVPLMSAERARSIEKSR